MHKRGHIVCIMSILCLEDYLIMPEVPASWDTPHELFIMCTYNDFIQVPAHLCLNISLVCMVAKNVR